MNILNMKLTKTESTLLADIQSQARTEYTSKNKRIDNALRSLIDKNLIKCVKTTIDEYPTKNKERAGCTMERIARYSFIATSTKVN